MADHARNRKAYIGRLLRQMAAHENIEFQELLDSLAGVLAQIAVPNALKTEMLQLLDELRSLGLRDDTLVVLSGDHGESLGEHGEQTHSFFIYDCTVTVPLIFSAPARLGWRSLRRALVSI